MSLYVAFINLHHFYISLGVHLSVTWITASWIAVLKTPNKLFSYLQLSVCFLLFYFYFCNFEVMSMESDQFLPFPFFIITSYLSISIYSPSTRHWKLGDTKQASVAPCPASWGYYLGQQEISTWNNLWARYHCHFKAAQQSFNRWDSGVRQSWVYISALYLESCNVW